MKLRYRDKTYDSIEIPIFVYFTNNNKNDFVNILKNYKIGTFQAINCVQVAFAGSTTIKDKRATLYFCIDTADEKRAIQKSTFDNDESEDNAMLCAPDDISEVVLMDWVDKNLKTIK